MAKRFRPNSMIIASLLLASSAAPAPLPQPLNKTHMRDIGCVATLAIVAGDQRRGALPSQRFPNVMQRGPEYASIVGHRIVAETGQPQEVVGLAIQKAAEAQRAKLVAAKTEADPSTPDAAAPALELERLLAPCLARLDAEVPEQAAGADDYLFCAAIITIAADDIAKREGEESVNARAMRGLAQQLTAKYSDRQFPPDAPQSAPQSNLPKDVWVRMMIDREIAKQMKLAKNGGGLETLSEVNGEAKYQRCIFLGE